MEVEKYYSETQNTKREKKMEISLLKVLVTGWEKTSKRKKRYIIRHILR